MKKCTKCGIEKNNDQFPVRKKKYLEAQCKACYALKSREYYEKNRDRCNENRRKHYEENREETLKRQKEYYFKNHAKIRERVNASRKTPEEREKIRKAGREWAKRNPEKHSQRANEWKKRNPLKSKAHQYVFWALKLGVLVKGEVCEKCGMKTKLDSHHEDYAKPLEVKWLCRLCHMHTHDKLLDINPGEYYGCASG